MSSKLANSDEDDVQRFMKVTIPLCCDAMVPITAKLLKKHKDIKEIDDELNLRREEFNTRMRKITKRRSELRKKEELLINSLKEFEGFIEEREKHKKEAQSKYSQEKRFIAEIDREFIRLQEERDVLTMKKQDLENYLEKYLPAYRFLESVAEVSVQFEDVGDIISFYDTLVAVHKELTEKEKRELEATDHEREELRKFKTEKGNLALALSNQLYELQQERDHAHDKVLAMEAHFNDVKSSNNKKAMTSGQITMAISSMYMTICDFEKVTPTEKNPVKQMEKIHDFIQDWSEVVQEIKKTAEQEHG